MRYLVLGSNGMAGHVIATYLFEKGNQVDGLSRCEKTPIDTIILDATNFDELNRIITNNKYDIIVNCIGLLNDAANSHVSQAILINSYLPHWLAEITSNMKTKIIHLSTDCVFSGKNGNYSENDFPDGSSTYDRTKALGELKDHKNLTFRNSIIGPDINEQGIGLFNWFMHQSGTIKGYTKSIWTGVTTLTLAKAIEAASSQDLTGLYHLVNNCSITKFDLCTLFNHSFKNDSIKIERVDGINHDKSLTNHRNDFNFVVPSYETMVDEMKEWVNNHKEYYPHYLRG